MSLFHHDRIMENKAGHCLHIRALCTKQGGAGKRSSPLGYRPQPATYPSPSAAMSSRDLAGLSLFFHWNCSFFLGLCLNFLGMEGRDDVTTTPGNSVAYNYCFSDMLYRYTWKSLVFPSFKIHGSRSCTWRLRVSDSLMVCLLRR